MIGEVFGEVWIVTPVAPQTVNDVSYVMRTKYVSLSACIW